MSCQHQPNLLLVAIEKAKSRARLNQVSNEGHQRDVKVELVDVCARGSLLSSIILSSVSGFPILVKKGNVDNFKLLDNVLICHVKVVVFEKVEVKPPGFLLLFHTSTAERLM